MAIYAHFSSPLEPDADLVEACLRSYAKEKPGGVWRLAKKDRRHSRELEQQTMIKHLVELGNQLGFRSRTRHSKSLDHGTFGTERDGFPGAFDVAWIDGSRIHSVFAVRWQATMGEPLSQRIPAPETVPYFVIPGGRAGLVNYKLAHNPLWQQAMDRGNWRFIKYRHVRQLAAQPDIDEYALRTIIGLDPIVEKDQAQLTLF
jgi:hypothetical protein